MYFLESIINIAIVILLLRLLIKPAQAYFDPIYRLLYRITDPMLMPSRYITRNLTGRILLSVLALLVLRGLVYSTAASASFSAGMGASFIRLFGFIFQAYMVLWFITLLSQYGPGTTLLHIMERAFLPLYTLLVWLKIPKKQFHIFVFLFLWILYALLRAGIGLLTLSGPAHPGLIIHALGEGLLLVVGLFPGFFSLIIIIGALLSWVSPDPSNPIVQIIHGISEPLLRPFRKFLPNLGGLDISPILALLCFQLLGKLLQEVILNAIRMASS